MSNTGRKRVIVWGTGNVGRPAIRAVHNHRDLELAGVVVSQQSKVGRDAGELAGMEPLGVKASDDWQALLDEGIDAVVYTATADTRPEEATEDLLACLRAGVNVVSTSFYSFLHPGSSAAEALQPLQEACADGNASLLVSGIDPGWAMDMLPLALSGAVSGIREIRTREIFNYALYDQPDVVRNLIGFGGPMADTPLMLHDFAIEMVWAPMLRILGEGLDKPVDHTEVKVERRALDSTVNVPGMGVFEEGTQGAFRFEIIGYHDNQPLFVLEHVTRIDDNCATDWPYPPEGQGCHQVIISGDPDLHVTVHGEDHFDSGPASGGNASAANWIVNAIPDVCAAAAGPLTILDLPAITGAAQIAPQA